MDSDFLNKVRSCTTCGQKLSDDRVIDLVASAEHENLDLIVFDGECQLIVPQLEHDGVIYRPPELDATVRSALRFPTDATEYYSALDLVAKVSQLCRRYFELSEVMCTLGAFWAASTWVPERFYAPPTLYVAGCGLAQGMRFFRFVRAICRRGLAVGNLTPRLPLHLQPTLLVVGSGLSKKTRDTWRTCGYHGVYVPSNGGRLGQLSCAKAIFSESADAVDFSDESLRLLLLAQSNPIAELNDSDLDTIAAELQPKFQLFRLRSLHAKSLRVVVPCPAELAESSLGREFFALLAGEPEVRKLLLPVVEQQRQVTIALRERNPHAVIVEVLWIPAHELKLMTTSEVEQRANTLLRARGETLVYSAKELGWKLSDLGLSRLRTGKGMVLKFSRETCRRIHELAEQFGLKLSRMNGCPDCARVQVIEPQAPV